MDTRTELEKTFEGLHFTLSAAATSEAKEQASATAVKATSATAVKATSANAVKATFQDLVGEKPPYRKNPLTAVLSLILENSHCPEQLAFLSGLNRILEQYKDLVQQHNQLKAESPEGADAMRLSAIATALSDLSKDLSKLITNFSETVNIAHQEKALLVGKKDEPVKQGSVLPDSKQLDQEFAQFAKKLNACAPSAQNVFIDMRKNAIEAGAQANPNRVKLKEMYELIEGGKKQEAERIAGEARKKVASMADEAKKERDQQEAALKRQEERQARASMTVQVSKDCHAKLKAAHDNMERILAQAVQEEKTYNESAQGARKSRNSLFERLAHRLSTSERNSSATKLQPILDALKKAISEQETMVRAAKTDQWESGQLQEKIEALYQALVKNLVAKIKPLTKDPGYFNREHVLQIAGLLPDIRVQLDPKALQPDDKMVEKNSVADAKKAARPPVIQRPQPSSTESRGSSPDSSPESRSRSLSLQGVQPKVSEESGNAANAGHQQEQPGPGSLPGSLPDAPHDSAAGTDLVGEDWERLVDAHHQQRKGSGSPPRMRGPGGGGGD